MRRKILAASLVAVLAFSLTACSGGKAETAAPKEEEVVGTESVGTKETEAEKDSKAGETAGEKVTLGLCWWGNQTRNDLTKKAVDLYMSQNPDVEIKVEFTDWSGYWDKLSTMAAGGNLPDIIQQDYSYIAQYQKSGQLADLSEFINNGTIDASNIPESIIESGSIDGTCYALSLGSNAPSMIYDKAIVEEAGVTIPKQLTVDEMYELSNTIYEKTGAKTLWGSGLGMMSVAARARGSHLYDQLFAGDMAAAEEHFTSLEKFSKADFALPADILVEKNPDVVETKPIIDQTSWNDFSFSNQFISVSTTAGRALGITMEPIVSNSVTQSMYLKPSMFFSIAETSMHKEEAAKFIDWFTNSVECNEILMAERGIPINTEVAKAIKPMTDEITQIVFDYVNEVAEIATPIDPPDPAGTAEVTELCKTCAEDVRYGDLNGQEAAEKFVTEAKKILEEAAK